MRILMFCLSLLILNLMLMSAHALGSHWPAHTGNSCNLWPDAERSNHSMRTLVGKCREDRDLCACAEANT